jgi:hypothetical protein
MKFLIAFILGAAWAFYVAVLMDRPDLARVVTSPWGLVAHAGFALLLTRTVIGVSWDEIRSSRLRWRDGFGVLLRNLIVTLLGETLLVFISRTLLNGIDPTHHRALW